MKATDALITTLDAYNLDTDFSKQAQKMFEDQTTGMIQKPDIMGGV